MSTLTQAQIAEITRAVGGNVSKERVEEAVRAVLQKMQGNGLTASSSSSGKLDVSSYPLGEKRRDLVRSATGKSLDEITLEKVVSGEIKFDDIKTRPETLELQAQVAESAGRPNLASNLRRAKEMTQIPDARLLEMYNSLRPYRATKAEMVALAEELEGKYGAKACGKLVREAADAYEKNKRLKGDR